MPKRTLKEYRELSKSQYYRDLKHFVQESESTESTERPEISDGNHLVSIVRNEPEEISESKIIPVTLEEDFNNPSGNHSISMVKTEPEEISESGIVPLTLEKVFLCGSQSAKPSCSKTQAEKETSSETLSVQRNKNLEECCCKHIQYIYRQMKKNEMEIQLHKNILKRLPLQTKEELEEFDKSLYVQSNKETFRNIAQNLTLKQFLSDDVVLEMKFSGHDSKKGFKDYRFYNIWKEASSSQDFAEIIKGQMRAAKSRRYSARHKRKKNAGNNSNEDNNYNND